MSWRRVQASVEEGTVERATEQPFVTLDSAMEAAEQPERTEHVVATLTRERYRVEETEYGWRIVCIQHHDCEAFS